MKVHNYKIMTSISPREYQVLQLISQEKTMKEIASMLFLSEHTVHTHRKNLLQKLQAKNTAGLMVRAYEKGLLMMNITH